MSGSQSRPVCALTMAFVAVVAAFCTTHAAPAQDQSVPDLLSSIEQIQRATLTHFPVAAGSAVVRRTQLYAPEVAEQLSLPPQTEVLSRADFKIKDGKIRVAVFRGDESTQSPSVLEVVRIDTGQKHFFYTPASNTATIAGTDIPFPVRSLGDDFRLDAFSTVSDGLRRDIVELFTNLDSCQVETLSDGTIRISGTWENPQDASIHSEYIYQLDPQKGCLPTRCEFKFANGGMNETQTVVYEAEWEPLDTGWIPKKARRKREVSSVDAQGNTRLQESQEVEVEMLSFDPHAAVEDADFTLAALHAPEDARVVDSRVVALLADIAPAMSLDAGIDDLDALIESQLVSSTSPDGALSEPIALDSRSAQQPQRPIEKGFTKQAIFAMVAGVALLLAAAVTAAVLFRKRGPRHGKRGNDTPISP